MNPITLEPMVNDEYPFNAGISLQTGKTSSQKGSVKKKMKGEALLLVKVQLPIATNTVRTALVYDKTRRFNGFYQATDDLYEEMGANPKDYFHAHVLENGSLRLIKKINWQNW